MSGDGHGNSERNGGKGRDRDRGDRTGQSNEEAHERSVAEWTMLAVSVAALLAVVVAVVWLWLMGEPRPPAFSTTARPVREVSGSVHVPVEVRNEGTRTAAGVQVTMKGPQGQELAGQRIDLPEPRSGLSFTVSGYQTP